MKNGHQIIPPFILSPPKHLRLWFYFLSVRHRPELWAPLQLSSCRFEIPPRSIGLKALIWLLKELIWQSCYQTDLSSSQYCIMWVSLFRQRWGKFLKDRLMKVSGSIYLYISTSMWTYRIISSYHRPEKNKQTMFSCSSVEMKKSFLWRFKLASVCCWCSWWNHTGQCNGPWKDASSEWRKNISTTAHLSTSPSPRVVQHHFLYSTVYFRSASTFTTWEKKSLKNNPNKAFYKGCGVKVFFFTM